MAAAVDYASAGLLTAETAGAGSRGGDGEALLIARAQAGDQIAFFEIVERYQRKVFSTIHRLLRDQSEAEDVAQEVFASAFFSIRKYRRKGSLMSWLHRIAVNESYEYLRRKRARPLVYAAEINDEWQRTLDSRSAVQPADAELAGRDFAIKLLARIPKRDRALLLMKEVEGYSLQELADIVGISEGALRLRLFRARKTLLKAGRCPSARPSGIAVSDAATRPPLPPIVATPIQLKVPE